MRNYGILLLSVFYVCNASVDIVRNPDDSDKIERPCPTYDLNCIRDFFQKHAHCKKMLGPAPDPIRRPQNDFYFPSLNITVTFVDQRVNGLNGRIDEFYINRETDNLVIAVEFTNVTFTSDKNFFKFHRRAKEPVVTVASGQLRFFPLITTAVIPNVDNLMLTKAECTTFSTGSEPAELVISPQAAESTDPQAATALTALLANLPTDIQELFLTNSAYLILTYIQYNICDFGLIVP